ncbi:MAG: MarR family transcriptional regulator [Novosphingobium sp.]|nr:MarR family transcriptional regulator [Novosphingobium sp.]
MRSRFYPVMRELLTRESATIGELASAAQVSQPAMTQTVGEMVAAGLLERSEAEDRRTRLVGLSPRGRAAVGALWPVWNAVAAAAAGLDEELSMPLARLLKEALAALERRDFAARIEQAKGEA